MTEIISSNTKDLRLPGYPACFWVMMIVGDGAYNFDCIMTEGRIPKVTRVVRQLDGQEDCVRHSSGSPCCQFSNPLDGTSFSHQHKELLSEIET